MRQLYQQQEIQKSFISLKISSRLLYALLEHQASIKYHVITDLVPPICHGERCGSKVHYGERCGERCDMRVAGSTYEASPVQGNQIQPIGILHSF